MDAIKKWRDGPLLPSHTLPPIDIGEELALVCGLPTAIKGKAERRNQYTSRLRFASSSFPRSN